MPYINPEDKKKWNAEHREGPKKWKRENPDKVKECQRKARERNEELIKDKKLSGCAVCGENRLPCLDLHHKYPEEKNNIQLSRRGLRRDKLLAELAGRVVLCANCHRLFHYNDRSGPWRRGKKRTGE